MKKFLIHAILLGWAAAVSALPTWEPFTTNSGSTAYNGGNLGSNLEGQTNASGEKWFDWNEGTSATNVIITNYNLLNMPWASGYGQPSFYGTLPTNSILVPHIPNADVGGQSACLGFNRVILPPAGKFSAFGAATTNRVFASFLIGIPNSQDVAGSVFFAGLVCSNQVTNTTGFPNGAAVRINLGSNGTVTPFGMGVYDTGSAPITPGTTFQQGNFESSNTLYFVVMDYELSGTNTSGTVTNDHVKLWIDPNPATFGAASAPAIVSGGANVSYQVASTLVMTNVAGFYIRARNADSMPTNGLFMGAMAFGTTWSYVTGGPEFSIQPTNITVNGGSNVVLTSLATAVAGQSITYQWFKNGVALSDGIDTNGSTISGSFTTNLSISGLAQNDGGSYTVVATDPVSSIASATAVLTLDPNVTSYPVSGSVLVTGTTNLTVVASTSTGFLTYQWQRDGVNLTDGTSGTGTVYIGSQTSTLTLSNISTSDSGATYDVAVTNATGGWVITPPMTLTVNHLLISSQPASVNTNYGGTVSFSAAPSPAGSYNYQWELNGNILNNGPSISGSGATVSGATTTNLTIAGVTYLDVGSYTLTVNGGNGNQATSAAAVLTVNDPYLLTQPASQQANAGSTVTFAASAAGSPTLSYQWESNGVALSDGGGVTGSQTSSLTLSSVTDADAASYNLVVNGGSGVPVTSSTAILSVFDSPSIPVAINSYVVNPGVHIAFTVVAAGTPPFSYQWEFDGSPLPGATNSSLVITNVQVGTNGTYSVLISNTIANGAIAGTTASGTLTVTPTLITLPTANLIVARVGDGAQTLNVSQGNTLYLDQFSTTGSYVATTMVPDSGPSALVVAGGTPDGLYESVLTTSSNDLYLNFAGFNLSIPNTSGNDLGSGTVRAVAGISGLGGYVLDVTNSGLFSGGTQIRSATSTDGLTNFWLTGNSSTIEYITPFIDKNGTSIPTLTSASYPDWRVAQVNSNSGQLFVDGGSGNASVNPVAVGLLYFPGGAPTAAANPSLYENSDPTANPDDFAISPDGNTIYIADDRTNGNGGIQRWDNSGLAYTLSTGNSLVGARGIVVDFSASATWGSGVEGAVIYATTGETVTNRLIKIVDEGGGSTPTLLQTAGPNQLFRGLRFGLQTAPVSIVTQPLSQTNYAGSVTTFSVQVAGSAPFDYQWSSNGIAVPGATNSSFVISNTPVTAAGTYTVTVNNGLAPVTSGPATLTVLTQAATLLAPLQSWTVGANTGTRVVFAPDFVGSFPLTITWTSNGTVIPGATNATLIITNVQSTNAGTYSLSISNPYGHASGSATLTVLPGLASLSTNNLVIARVGDGAQTLNTNQGNTLYFDQFTPGGAYVNTSMVPDSGPKALVVAGAPPDGSLESCLTVSTNDEQINFAGFNVTIPYSGTDIGAAGVTIRGIGALSGTGAYTLCLTNVGLYSAGITIRSAASSDGLYNFWTTGGGLTSTPGIKYINPTIDLNGQGIVEVATGGQNDTRVVEVINTNLFYTSGASGAVGLYFASGLPETTTAATVQLITESSGSPDDFAVSPDTNTIYIADDSASSSGGGIQRWDLSGGVYSLSYTLTDPTSYGTNGVRSLVVNWGTATTWGPGANGAIIFATTAEASSNRLITVTDNGSGSAPTLLATAYPNEVFRGIRFGPAVVPLTITTQPQSQSVYVGQTADLLVAVTGSGPINYQWSFDGTPLAGATNADLSFASVQMTNAGTYTVVINNGVGTPLTSSSAVLNVLPFSASGDLVGWWKFNDGSGLTAADSSGNGNTGSLTNFPTDNSEWVTGFDGMGALNFVTTNGSTSNTVVVADSPTVNFTNNVAFTIAVWIKTPSTNQISGAGIVAKGYGSGGEQYALDLYNGSFRFYVRNSAGTYFGFATSVPPDNQWEQIVATCDGKAGTMVLYTNGEVIGSAAAPTSLLYTTVPMSIGNRFSATNGGVYNLPFAGEMQDVRLYSAALGASDVQALYQSLAVPASPSQFASSHPLVMTAPGTVQLTFSGVADTTFRLWSTTNLNLTPVTSEWNLLTNGTFNSSGTAVFTETNATNETQYYVITQP
jgi:hypothetical protein